MADVKQKSDLRSAVSRKQNNFDSSKNFLLEHRNLNAPSKGSIKRCYQQFKDPENVLVHHRYPTTLLI